jgi:hypothetical protein
MAALPDNLNVFAALSGPGMSVGDNGTAKLDSRFVRLWGRWRSSGAMPRARNTLGSFLRRLAFRVIHVL